MKKLLTLMLLVAICSPALLAQDTPAAKTDAKAAATEKLNKESVVLLRETLAEVSNLRLPENRIAFSAQLASLLWRLEPTEAKAVLAGVVADFRSLVQGYDAEILALGPSASDDAGYEGGFLGDVGLRARLQRKFSTAVMLRDQLALTLAKNDPEAALDFFYGSTASVNSPEFRKTFENQYSGIESQLLMQLINAKSARAVELASRSLEGGFAQRHLDLLRRIYAKDPAKAAEFAAAILARVKTDKLDSAAYSVVDSLLEFGDEKLRSSQNGSTKAVYSAAQMRELADVFAQQVLDLQGGEGLYAASNIELIERYSPSRAAQIRMRREQARVARADVPYTVSHTATGNTVNSFSISNVSNVGGPNAAAANSAAIAAASRAAERAAPADAQLTKDIAGLSGAEMSKDEREAVIVRARKAAAETSAVDKKLTLLTLLATQLARAGDKEAAGALMSEASALINPAPRSSRDYIFTLMVINGYAQSDPERAFPLLEDTVGRVNDTIAAFVKVGEFFDVSGEMIDESGELKIAGMSMLSPGTLLNGSAVTNLSIQALAEFDFARLRAVTNRFDRPETRIIAKLMVLQSLDPTPPSVEQGIESQMRIEED